ncbi:hypothetical protein BD311DRAFT_865529 [Dichomitus squalens]|uniref:Uncharacterized protein n=1 Tax=Dichomitus squalens TaxID=114155 RepID=A0A4Q9MQB3_9APHY|nr:hypothetical protein BD311DRAFT_865529 [Dichomitus squalens]
MDEGAGDEITQRRPELPLGLPILTLRAYPCSPPPSTLLLASCLSEYAHTLDSLPTAKIYEEALRLKLGGEGKIRIVCHVVDGLCSDRAHMRTLLDRILDKNFSKTAEQLGRKTLYLHVTSKQYYPPGMTGEEKKDDDVDLITTPRRKERLEGAPAPR